MIYTVGHTLNYRQALAEHGRIWKIGQNPEYAGGYAFQTIDDARRFIAELGHADDWSVWGLSADWTLDTDAAPDGWWHYLRHDAEIIALPSPQP